VTNRTAIRAAPVLAAIVLAGGVLLALATGLGVRQGSSGGEWLDYLSLEAMVADSDAVVVAELMFVETVRVEAGKTAQGEVYTYDTKVASWRPSAWLMGTPSVGEVFYVETGDVPLNIGATHVLFLKKRENTDGMAQWSLAGEPFFALVEPGGQLRFIASERYREQHTEGGRMFPVDGSDAPFEATLEDVGRAVSILTATPAPTVRAECGRGPSKESFDMTFIGGAMRVTWADCWDDEEGFVVVVSYPGPNFSGQPSEQFEFPLQAGVTEFEIPEEAAPFGAGHPDCVARNDVDVNLFVLRGGGRSIVSGSAVVGMCR